MKSDPQLRQDIRTLQEEVLRLQSALAEARAKPPVEVEKVVIKQVVQFHDKPETLAELAKARAQIERMKAQPPRVETVDRVVKVEVPTERVVYRDRVQEMVVTVEKPVTVIEYQDNPKTLRKLHKALAEIARLKAMPPKVDRVVDRVEVPVDRIVEKVVPQEVVVTVEKVVRVPVDNPALVAEIAGLKAELAIIKRGGE